MLSIIQLTSIEISRSRRQCSRQANKTAYWLYKNLRSNRNRSTYQKLISRMGLHKMIINDLLLIGAALNKLKMDKITTRTIFLNNWVRVAELRAALKLWDNWILWIKYLCQETSYKYLWLSCQTLRRNLPLAMRPQLSIQIITKPHRTPSNPLWWRQMPSIRLQKTR